MNIPPGGAMQWYFANKLPLISATVKDLDVSSTDPTAVYRAVLAAG